MKNNGPIGIIGAMDIEVDTLKASIDNCKTEKVGEMTFFSGTLNGAEVIVVKCGIGKVNAARCAQTLADRFSAAAIINTGIGGGIGDGLAVGDIVIGESLVQHDFDVSGFGYAKGYMFLGDKDKPTEYIADKRLIELIENAALKHIPAQRIKRGIIATGDIFVSDAEKKSEIRNGFNALVTEMEGAAIAQTARANNIPFAVVRALSDLADGSAAESYEAFEKETAYLSAEIIKSFLSML